MCLSDSGEQLAPEATHHPNSKSMGPCGEIEIEGVDCTYTISLQPLGELAIFVFVQPPSAVREDVANPFILVICDHGSSAGTGMLSTLPK